MTSEDLAQLRRQEISIELEWLDTLVDLYERRITQLEDALEALDAELPPQVPTSAE